MRMINSQKGLVTLAHLSLCDEELFGRSLVRDFCINGDISETVNRLCAPVFSAADQSTAFRRRGLARMSDYIGEVRSVKLQS